MSKPCSKLVSDAKNKNDSSIDFFLQYIKAAHVGREASSKFRKITTLYIAICNLNIYIDFYETNA